MTQMLNSETVEAFENGDHSIGMPQQTPDNLDTKPLAKPSDLPQTPQKKNLLDRVTGSGTRAFGSIDDSATEKKLSVLNTVSDDIDFSDPRFNFNVAAAKIDPKDITFGANSLKSRFLYSQIPELKAFQATRTIAKGAKEITEDERAVSDLINDLFLPNEYPTPASMKNAISLIKVSLNKINPSASNIASKAAEGRKRPN